MAEGRVLNSRQPGEIFRQTAKEITRMLLSRRTHGIIYRLRAIVCRNKWIPAAVSFRVLSQYLNIQGKSVYLSSDSYYCMMITNNNKGVFEKMARTYVREDSHWGSDLDLMKASLDGLVQKERNVRWLDIGCGPGFHLAAIAELYPEIKAEGIDYSPLILGEAKERIKRFELQNAALKEADILEGLPDNRYNLITFLNNGLGNLYRDGANQGRLRKEMIGNISGLLDENGYFILSVYNKEKLHLNYGGNLALLESSSDLENGDLFIEYSPPDGERVSCYSHWFSEIELFTLAKEARLEIDFLERRMARFLARCRTKHEK